MSHTTVVRRRMEAVINRVLAESGRPPRVYTDHDRLAETIGLDSLDLAQAVVSLEREFGIDPFREGASRVATFGELVSLYERALGRSD